MLNEIPNTKKKHKYNFVYIESLKNKIDLDKIIISILPKKINELKTEKDDSHQKILEDAKKAIKSTNTEEIIDQAIKVQEIISEKKAGKNNTRKRKTSKNSKK